MTSWSYCYFWISYWIFRLSLFFHPHPSPSSLSPPPPTPAATDPIPTPDEIYTTPRIVHFERKFATLSDANLDAIFTQSYEEYWKHVSETKDNDLECTWRRRLVMECTPRGVVLMYYDAFKRGFAYYSDAAMPYGILNVVAMKYVTTFQCRAFFVDQDYFPLGHTSPILVLDEKDASAVAAHHPNRPLTQGPFLQSKNTPKHKDNVPKKELRKNRFLNLGRVVNCRLIPPPPIKLAASASASAATATAAATTTTTYTDYKFWKSQHVVVQASQVFAAIKQ